jgi:hypothetical protein
MADQGIRFIRRNGHVIPIGTKGKPGDWKTSVQTKKMGVGQRAAAGAYQGAKRGAVIGAAVGVFTGVGKPGVSILKSAAAGAFGGAIGGAAARGLMQAAFGPRSITTGTSVYAPKRRGK